MTTTVTRRRSLSGRLGRAAMLGLLAFAAALCSASEARAQWATSGANINNTNTGNVGIGTPGPSGLLQVKKDQNAPTSVYVTNETDGTLALTRMLFGDHLADTDLFFTSYNTGFSGNGTLGIPGAGLAELAANTNATGMAVGTRGAAPFIVTTNATERLRVSSGGNVGIGTSNPVGRLDVRQVGNAGTLATILTSSGASEDTFIRGGGSSAAVHIGDLTSTTSKLLLMENGGKVGVGTTAPSTALHVVGDVTVSGNISAKYQDVAEWVPSRQKLRAGTVVVLDATANNHVVASTSAYDTGVAGVVSEQPGLILGEGGEGKVMVATTGRVKVRVDATRAPVRIGDLLVTGDAPGVAMKSEPISVGGRKLHAPGTIVGKALEPLADGVGEILVLLSLQ